MPCELRIWSITVTSKHTNQSHVTYIQTFQDRCPPTYEGWCVHESLYEILMKSMSQIGNSPFRFHRPQRSITAQHSTYPVPYVHMKMRRFTDQTPTVISRQDIFVLWALTQQTRYFHISPNHITSHQINATQKRAIWNWTTNWSKTQNGFVKIKLKIMNIVIDIKEIKIKLDTRHIRVRQTVRPIIWPRLHLSSISPSSLSLSSSSSPAKQHKIHRCWSDRSIWLDHLLITILIKCETWETLKAILWNSLYNVPPSTYPYP